MVIEDDKCETCPALRKFDSTSSKSFSLLDDKIMKLEYGSAKLTGVRATDRVCVQNSLCLSSFEFFLAAANEGLPG